MMTILTGVGASTGRALGAARLIQCHLQVVTQGNGAKRQHLLDAVPHCLVPPQWRGGGTRRRLGIGGRVAQAIVVVHDLWPQ